MGRVMFLLHIGQPQVDYPMVVVRTLMTPITSASHNSSGTREGHSRRHTKPILEAVRKIKT